MKDNFLDFITNSFCFKNLKFFQKSEDSKGILMQDSNTQDSPNTTQKGKEAEDLACEFLIGKGFAILERNFHTRFGELDIIAKKDGILHFVEVKSGIGFEPVYNLSPAKLEKLTKTLNIYLDKHAIQVPYCLSALILFKQDSKESFCIRWLENLTIF